MRSLNLTVFDEVIAGTSTNWYSADEYNETLGTPDDFLVVALATNVSGSPDVNIFMESSLDGRSWFAGAGPLQMLGITEGAMTQGQAFRVPRFVRFRSSLGGTGGSCRLKLSVTGRSWD